MGQVSSSSSVYTATRFKQGSVPLQEWARHTHLKLERCSYACQEQGSNNNPVVGLQRAVRSEGSDWDY